MMQVRGTQHWALGALVLAGWFALPPAVLAQPAPTGLPGEQMLAPAARVMVFGLVAVEQTRLIRTSGMADAAAIQRIAELEAALSLALERADAAERQGAAASAEAQRALQLAAEARDREVGLLFVRLGHDPRPIEQFRGELTRLATTFTPEEIRLRTRFAYGDRVGTWPQIRELSLAWDRAVQAASGIARAERLRSEMMSHLVV